MVETSVEVCVIAFGAARDIVGAKETRMRSPGQTVGDLRAALVKRYPDLAGLRSLYVAVNNAYADDSLVLQPSDEIALIPPVSGG